jgi:DNA mismatch repair protein MutL
MGVVVLPQSVVDMIAAGEVIERPASAVKELLENALDAGAGRIDVRVENGGKDRVTVTDDGSGMNAEDLGLAVLSHATSKIRCAEDIFEVATFGFRGEALPSIGVVSKMELRSRPHEADTGAVIRVQGGEVEGPEPAGCPPGTTVDVRNLFFNTPVRRKFLKSTSTETYHVSSQVTRAALARPDVGFSLAHGSRQLLALEPVEELKDRIRALFGRDLTEDLLPVSFSEVGLTLTGYIAPPPHSRSNRSAVFTYINGRYVRDRVLLHAVSQAFREHLTAGRHPVVFLYFNVAPGEIDVNVHPTKIEVRFRRASQMHGILSTMVRGALSTSGRAVPLELGEPASPAGKEGDPAARRREAALEAVADFYDRVGPGEASVLEGFWGKGGGETRGGESAGPAPPPAGLPPVLQVHDAFLIRQTEGGIEIIDQHALHERVLYDEIVRRAGREGLDVQRLLVPVTVEVEPGAEALILEHAEFLLTFGLEIESFGPGTLAVQGIPPFLPDTEVEAFLRDMADDLSGRGAGGSGEEKLGNLARRLACRGAVKAGEALPPAKIQTLLRRAQGLPELATCPHGRPAVLRLSLEELARHFRRT